MQESNRPFSNSGPDNLKSKFLFHLRLFLDLQNLTVYRDLKKVLPTWTGAVLDIGCGFSPYKHLLKTEGVAYTGTDVKEAAEFGYANPDVVYYEGTTLPFANEAFDHILCTEVLEHVRDHKELIAEIYRILKPGGSTILTVPWSARFHYKPHDYFRYTPSALAWLFSDFSQADIRARGTDVSVVANKVLLIFVRNIIPTRSILWIFVPLWVILLPIPALLMLLAHISLIFGLGSQDDPLGYTLLVKK